MSIKDRSKRIILGGAAAVGLTLGVAALSAAATTPAQQPAPPAAEQDDTQDPSLNGSVQAPEDESASEADEGKALEGLAKISAADADAAALAAIPGGTVNETELGNENGSVVYEVDVTDADGKSVEVKVDAGNGDVLAQDADDEGSEANEAADGPEDEEAGAQE